ncbi:MAG: serine/threonine-protein kinase, partial [Planctomycetota bacterium]
GIVFLAEQREPVRRRVALKVIKPGMDTRQVIARFEAERQARAMMDHPNIAKVHDAGVTPSGQPYFVMELVKGKPITDLCDEQRLSIDGRLRLLVPVCHAIQHAHQKGVIHRDIKPSNVLVSLYDGAPVPKVIDFGVAKAIERPLTDKTLFTEFGQVIGTPEYMSPEQAELNQLDVDTRSDVYGLGALLYELLTGSTPLERDRLRSAAFDQMLRMLREEEPPKPSVRLSGSESLPSVSARRSIEPKSLGRRVRGDLDWVTMRALEKDRSRRYSTAKDLADDLERALDGEPVEAGPPSNRYRFGKFLYKHRRVASTAAGFLALALIGATLLIRGEMHSQLVQLEADSNRRLAEQQAESIAAQDRLLYINRMMLADRERLVNNVDRAQELLAACPPEFRGWEWNYLTRACSEERTSLEHPGPVKQVAVSRDERMIATTCEDDRVRVWDLGSSELLHTLEGHETYLAGVAFGPDGILYSY